MSKTGLVSDRERQTIKAFFDQWADSEQVSERTRIKRRNNAKKVIAAFGADTLLNNVTPSMADELYQSFLADFSRAHANKLAKLARQVFSKAVRLKFISDSPFADIKIGDESNTDRQAFIDQATIEKVIDAATDNEFRLLIALARYAGLRVPSEIVGLKWGHVNWETSRIEITDVKRKRTRIIPIFEELRPHLELCWDEAETGSKFVIPSYRNPSANIRTRLVGTIKRAGLEAREKPWQNLRSSRETELAD